MTTTVTSPPAARPFRSPDAIGSEGARVAAAATMGNIVCMTAAISATFGTFLVPVTEEFGWPRAVLSGVLGLIAILSALSYPLIGRAMDRLGARRVILTGHVMLGVSIMTLGFAQPIEWLFYLQYALVGMGGAMCASPMIAKVVSDWFDARRGLMLGVTAGVGNGVGATIMPIIAGLLLPEIGWRATYVAIGAIVLLLGFPIMALWLRDTNASTQARVAGSVSAKLEGMTPGQAIRTPRFWLLLVAVASGAGGMTAVFTHVVPMMTDRGFGLGEATGIVVVFALVTAAWQVVTGGLLDKLSSPLLIVPMYLAAIGGLALLQFGTGSGAMLAAGTMLGLGMGAEYAALSYFCSRYFGLAHFGTINGLLYAAVILAQGVTPALLDLSYDATGSYDQSAIAIIAILGFGTVLLFFLPSTRNTTVAAPSQTTRAVADPSNLHFVPAAA